MNDKGKTRKQFINEGEKSSHKLKSTDKNIITSEQQSYHILDKLMEGCHVISNDWRYLYVNDAVVKQERSTKEELLGKTMMEVYPGIEKTKMFSTLKKCMKERISSFIENGFEFPGGEKGWFELRIMPVPEGLFFLSIDISQRKKAEQALKESEERYKDLVEKAGIAILIDDKDGYITYLNNKFAKMFGYSMQEMKKQSIRSVVHPRDREMVMKHHMNRMQGKKVPCRYEFKGIRKDGSSLYLEVDAVALKEKGNIIGSRSYFWDITERKNAENEHKQSYGKIRKALWSTVHAIASTVEKRDPYTSGHQKRVANLALAIAQEMRLLKNEIEGIHMAGSIHDLGKISVPSEILSKPSRLSEFEYKMIMQHPTVGYDILKGIKFSWPVAQIVSQHHERMNGSGYPKGLSGRKILLEARVLAVADVVEAMASHRPYRPALGLNKALEEISQNRGKLYDSEVADVCLKLFKEKGYKLMEKAGRGGGAAVLV